uniref:Uncharacterized protein n=1 Tax=Romanomermis culicivorax TaxID=13658 RepID=A0A915JN19_ROMCU
MAFLLMKDADDNLSIDIKFFRVLNDKFLFVLKIHGLASEYGIQEGPLEKIVTLEHNIFQDTSPKFQDASQNNQDVEQYAPTYCQPDKTGSSSLFEGHNK